MSEHSPLPLSLNDGDILDKDGYYIGYLEAADDEFVNYILTAVNTSRQLVETLKRIKEMIEPEYHRQMGNTGHVDRWLADVLSWTNAALKAAGEEG